MNNKFFQGKIHNYTCENVTLDMLKNNDLVTNQWYAYPKITEGLSTPVFFSIWNNMEKDVENNKIIDNIMISVLFTVGQAVREDVDNIIALLEIDNSETEVVTEIRYAEPGNHKILRPEKAIKSFDEKAFGNMNLPKTSKDGFRDFWGG